MRSAAAASPTAAPTTPVRRAAMPPKTMKAVVPATDLSRIPRQRDASCVVPRLRPRRRASRSHRRTPGSPHAAATMSSREGKSGQQQHRQRIEQDPERKSSRDIDRTIQLAAADARQEQQVEDQRGERRAARPASHVSQRSRSANSPEPMWTHCRAFSECGRHECRRPAGAAGCANRGDRVRATPSSSGVIV